ncbi:YbjQ family protein [Spongiimicrobium salis]|uniref:YbjQ family protein n=1 Tax=Spongiimicrobium salis TaxID=1667022 RepID=UPI00374D315F
MILSTTPSIEGKTITAYTGIVTGVTYTLNYASKGLSFKDVFNTQKYYENYEKGLGEAKESAFQKLRDNAKKLGANAVVGISVDVEMMSTNGYTMVSVVGTAVKLE